VRNLSTKGGKVCDMVDGLISNHPRTARSTPTSSRRATGVWSWTLFLNIAQYLISPTPAEPVYSAFRVIYHRKRSGDLNDGLKTPSLVLLASVLSSLQLRHFRICSSSADLSRFSWRVQSKGSLSANATKKGHKPLQNRRQRSQDIEFTVVISLTNAKSK
jgi:hypothetical protein